MNCTFTTLGTVKRIARTLSALGLIGFLMLLSLQYPPLLRAVNGNITTRSLLDVIGAVTALGTFLPWLLGLYHWGTSYRGSKASKRSWGFALILGFFIGAWFYWLLPTSGASVSSGESS